MKADLLPRFKIVKQRPKALLSFLPASLRRRILRGNIGVLTITGLILWGLSAYRGEKYTVRPFQAEKEQNYPCLLEKISDGDTVTALCHKQKIRIRLAGIDAPETGQKPAGAIARQALVKRLPKHFTLRYLGHDYYQRALGVLYNAQHQDVNLQMIADGYAFAYQGSSTPKAYRQAERQARQKKIGLWRDYPQLTNPKIWRRYHQ